MSGDFEAREAQRAQRWHLTPTPTVDPRVRIRLLAADTTGHPISVLCQFPLTAHPVPLLVALADAGFHADIEDTDLHPATTDRDVAAAWINPVPYPHAELHLTWTPPHPLPNDEDARESSVRAARAVLRRFGITRSPVVEQTWHDLV